MPMVGNVYRPDFQADNRLPSWVPMDDDQSGQAAGATSSFVDALKARMAGGAKTPIDGGFSLPMPASNKSAIGHEGLHDLPAIGGAAKGGGMSSL
jgi:hypothetical protein